MDKTRKLRSGFTTGACAQAAAKAAASVLFTGKEVKEIKICLPAGVETVFPVESTLVEREAADPGGIYAVACAVRKYSGDDPDVTDGILVYARVRRLEKPVFRVDGGQGVGRVTKPGLDQPVGAAAINRVPREMLVRTMEEACQEHDWPGGMEVIISMPEGVHLAAKTFNPRLGIEGGLSVLGTTGIVEPMSEKALMDTIQVEINVKRAAGREYLLAAPGNYGMDFLKEHYGIDSRQAVKCSNYIGGTIDMAVDSGAKGLLIVGHIGKLIKTAGGIMNTHSQMGDARMEITAAAMLKSGISPEKALKVLDCVTMDDALSLLTEEERQRMMKQVLAKIHLYLNGRTQGEMPVEAAVFSGKYGFLGMSEGAENLLFRIQQEIAGA